MGWLKAFFCVSCDGELSWGQKMYSNGCCPKCGENTGLTIVSTYSKSYKLVRNKPWWKNIGNMYSKVWKE